MSENQTLFRSRGKQLQEHEVLEIVYENETLSLPIRSNDLEVSERAVRILKTIQGVRGRRLLEIRKLLQKSIRGPGPVR